MAYRWPEGAFRDVPPFLEDGKVREGDAGCLRLNGEHGENRGIGVVFDETAGGDEGVKIVFIWDVATNKEISDENYEELLRGLTFHATLQRRRGYALACM